MAKAKVIEETLENFSKRIWGRSRQDDCCVQCGSEAIKPEDFDDDISRKEFTLTRWCQVCQNNFFGKEE